MSAPALLEVPPPLQRRLAALRDAGAQRLAPARLHYLEVLAQRIASAPEAVQRVLEARLDAALTAMEERLRQPQATAAEERTQPCVAPLVALNRYIQTLKQPGDANQPGLGLHSRPGHGQGSGDDAPMELASVRRFREAWSRIAAEDQVIEAVGRGPANAGPLNAHRLVLRTLKRLRDLSPDYLRRFLSQMETLQWLEQAGQTLTPLKPKPARRSRVKK